MINSYNAQNWSQNQWVFDSDNGNSNDNRHSVVLRDYYFGGVLCCRSDSPPNPTPTRSPTRSPTKSPTRSPTASPVPIPTSGPTKNPTGSPTESPTESPTKSPTPTTVKPTRSPSESPTSTPTASPTESPTHSHPTTESPTHTTTTSTTTTISTTTTTTTATPTIQSTNESITTTATTTHGTTTMIPTKNPTILPTMYPHYRPPQINCTFRVDNGTNLLDLRSLYLKTFSSKLNSINGTTDKTTWIVDFTPCQNGLLCNKSHSNTNYNSNNHDYNRAMAITKNDTMVCGKYLGLWNQSVGGIYSPDNDAYVFTYHNGNENKDCDKDKFRILVCFQ